jgi:FtsP/CotA-like multicopper oxidase with cupredoxin domain
MPGESFIYTLPLSDAGTFWFHSHRNETVQMERGLYGAIIVRGKDDPVVDMERVLVFDDMKLNKSLDFTTPSWFIPRWLERHNGREGNTLLINGKENTTIQMSAGQTERWRLINAGSAKYIRFSIGKKPFQILATDGGLIERARTVDHILLTPGERVDIAAGPFNEGEEFEIISLPYDRGVGQKKEEIFGKVKVGSMASSSAHFPIRQNKIESLAGRNTIANKQILLHGKRNWKNGVDFMINHQTHFQDDPVRVGELQVWEIHNPSMMDHPFHLHGFFFQVLEVNGFEAAFTAWKDTVNVPKGGTVKIAWMPDDRPGNWMYHCHILEHHEAGMMAGFTVIGENETANQSHQHHHHHQYAHQH